MSALSIAQSTLGSGASPDALELIRAVRLAMAEDPDLTSEDLAEHADVKKCFKGKARRRRGERKKTPAAADRRGEYDEEKCDARIWLAVPGQKNTGYSDIQCSAKKVDGCLCKKHAKQQEAGLLWCGIITEDPPENPIKVEGNGNEKEMIWYHEDGDESPPPKRPNLPHDVKEAKKKKKTPAKKGSPAKKKPEKKKPEKKKPEKKKPEKKKPEKKASKKKASKKKEVEKELGEMNPSEMSMAELQALMAAKKMMEVVKEKEDEDEDDAVSDGEETDELQSDNEDGEMEEINFEGVEYLMDTEKNVFNPGDMEKVGEWNAEDEDIDWINEEAAEEHAEKAE